MSFARHAGTALLVALATAVPTVAHADSYARNDPAGDVTKAVFDPDGAVVQPGRAEADIVRSGVSHGPHRINIAVRFRALSQSPDEFLYDVRIGHKKRVREVILTAKPGKWQGSIDVYNRAGNIARCKGIRWSIRYTDDLVLLSVPRRCLGSPSWVRVGVDVATFAGDDLYSDDAMTNGKDLDKIVYGPRVAR